MALITKNNVGRIAERIVSNELEYRGFRVSDLNSDGTAANADLLAVKSGKTWQIQVKGATQGPQDKRWWIQYGHGNPEIMRRTQPVFNRRTSFYTADIVILVAVRSPKEYQCIVLPVKMAERAAQLNLDRGYRTLKKDGTPKKAGKIWVHITRSPKARRESDLLDKEWKILADCNEKWEILD